MATYQLLENGVPVRNGSNSLGMWSRNMSTGGVFNHKCMANNSAGIAYSTNVTVTVNGKKPYRIICCELSDIMLCAGSSIPCSLFDFINLMKYAIYKLKIISISVIHGDKGGKKG